ncbi:MAG: ABC transporter permease [Rectinemataceae bacterium]|jgi:simple sugar transport system permease protein
MESGANSSHVVLKRNSWNKLITRPETGVTIGLIVVWSIFYLLSPKFLWPANIGSICTVAAEMGTIAVGMAFLQISGETDLSVGSVYVFVPTIMIQSAQALRLPIFIGFLIAMAFAVLVGFINGTITLRFKLPSFIVTLSTMMLLSGLLLAITGGFITQVSDENLWFTILAKRFGDFRISVLWMVLIVLFFHFTLTSTTYGNWVFATGGNETIARKMGINTLRVKMTNFIVCSMLAGFAGCISAARVYSVNPSVGFDLMFDAMASGIIGGCLLSGGRGSIIGTLLGVLLLSSVNSGLILAGASPYWYRAFVGAIILVVVIINLIVVGGRRGKVLK